MFDKCTKCGKIVFLSALDEFPIHSRCFEKMLDGIHNGDPKCPENKAIDNFYSTKIEGRCFDCGEKTMINRVTETCEKCENFAEILNQDEHKRWISARDKVLQGKKLKKKEQEFINSQFS